MINLEKFSQWIKMNESEDSFINKIKENPLDNTTWLVFADWLQEQGDWRADLIRAAKKPFPKQYNFNHLGEKQYRSFSSWKKAIVTLLPMAKFDGDKDICQALFNVIGIGEWDGDTGIIYDLNNIINKLFNIN